MPKAIENCPCCGQRLDAQMCLGEAKVMLDKMVAACENAAFAIANLEHDKQELITKARFGLSGSPIILPYQRGN